MLLVQTRWTYDICFLDVMSTWVNPNSIALWVF